MIVLLLLLAFSLLLGFPSSSTSATAQPKVPALVNMTAYHSLQEPQVFACKPLCK